MPAAKLMAVLGACRRRGRWEVSGRTSALVLFGHCYVDFREAYADPELETMKMNVICLFGNATFLMPEGADVRPSVVSLLASTAFDVPSSDHECSLPTIVIESTTVFGRCRVLIGQDEAVEDPDILDEATVDDAASATEAWSSPVAPPAVPTTAAIETAEPMLGATALLDQQTDRDDRVQTDQELGESDREADQQAAA